MKTFAETKGLPPFNWNECLANPRATVYPEDRFPDALTYVRSLASSWKTCAVGNQDARLLRTGRGVPHDYELFLLGARFSTEVCRHDFEKAQETLARIEARAGQLLAQMAKEDAL
jgi:hypothetical protein